MGPAALVLRYIPVVLGAVSGVLSNTEIRNIKAELYPNIDADSWSKKWRVAFSKTPQL